MFSVCWPHSHPPPDKVALSGTGHLISEEMSQTDKDTFVNAQQLPFLLLCREMLWTDRQTPGLDLANHTVINSGTAMEEGLRSRSKPKEGGFAKTLRG